MVTTCTIFGDLVTPYFARYSFKSSSKRSVQESDLTYLVCQNKEPLSIYHFLKGFTRQETRAAQSILILSDANKSVISKVK